MGAERKVVCAVRRRARPKGVEKSREITPARSLLVEHRVVRPGSPRALLCWGDPGRKKVWERKKRLKKKGNLGENKKEGEGIRGENTHPWGENNEGN